MQLAPQPVPLPPARGIGEPRIWDGRPLVRFEDPTGSGWTLQGVCLTDGNQKRIPVTLQATTAEQVKDERSGIEFQPVGTDFHHAVTIARRDAFTSNANDGKPYQSSAVLQGNNGAYYVTSLGGWYRKDNGRIGTTGSSLERFNISRPNDPVNVSALHPDVVAVVDRNSWVDLRSVHEIEAGLVDA